MKYFFVTLLCLAVLHAAPAHAFEWIQDFHSDITVNSDSSLNVTETIRVHADGINIKHGIFRDFPTIYKSEDGKRHKVGFSILEVSKDGASEPYHMASLTGGLRIYLGQRDVYLGSGFYTYKIAYRTDRQLRTFDRYDEIYWNVTGNEWQFPINHASVTIHLPSGASVVQYAAYTGVGGAREKNFRIQSKNAQNFAVETTGVLQPSEGLTVAVAFPKGVVIFPSASVANFFLSDDPLVAAGLGLLALLTLVYVVGWSLFGRDPKRGVIIPLFYPPADISPALCGQLQSWGSPNTKKLFSAALVNMAVKGYLRIEEKEQKFLQAKEYVLLRQKSSPKLAMEEQVIADDLSLQGIGSFTLSRKDSSNITKMCLALKDFKQDLQDRSENLYFKSHSGFKYFSIALVALYALWINYNAGIANVNFYFYTPVLVAMGAYAVHHVILGLFSFWTRTNIFVRSLLTLCLIICGVVSGLILLEVLYDDEMAAMCLLCIMVLVGAIYSYFMMAPTEKGRQMLDQIAGFRMYLETAEVRLLDVAHPPEMTPELFEKYLPYAMALNVETRWAHKFETEVADNIREQYRSTWYYGPSYSSFNSQSFVSNFTTSLANSISSISTTSSGSGGGGFSGGGGGGGGGGGW